MSFLNTRDLPSIGFSQSAEKRIDAGWISIRARSEKQAQGAYRPVLNIHKWYARRSGAMIRALLLAEFGDGDVRDEFYRNHELTGITILDPFMGGGSTIVESIRLGANVIGCDVNPMSAWTVREAIEPVVIADLEDVAGSIIERLVSRAGHLYQTNCRECGKDVPVTYFFWYKLAKCADCGNETVLVYDPILATPRRHPKAVLVCPECRQIFETDSVPEPTMPAVCPACGGPVAVKGPCLSSACPRCGAQGSLEPVFERDGTPQHRLIAMEYRCSCLPGRRQYAGVTDVDRARVEQVERLLAKEPNFPNPNACIEKGPETRRAHRWGYREVSDLFNSRQRFVMGALAQEIRSVEDSRLRRALATILSDMVRFNCELCRYDSWALKCRDAFSIHSFVVPLGFCEVNTLGTSGAGTGGFPQVLRRYTAAKRYCEEPYDVFPGREGGTRRFYTLGERVAADIVPNPRQLGPGGRKACLMIQTAESLDLPEGSVDAVITDPPYFDFVQYGDLLNVHRAWLEATLGEHALRASGMSFELTVKPGVHNRGPERFTEGLSRVFQKAATALSHEGLFGFTYHHSRVAAYVPLVVALLDAGLVCTLVLPYVAEMQGSLHIRGHKASCVDSLFLCRNKAIKPTTLTRTAEADLSALKNAGYEPSENDRQCILYGRSVARAVNLLLGTWDSSRVLEERIHAAEAALYSALVKEEKAHVGAQTAGAR